MATGGGRMAGNAVRWTPHDGQVFPGAGGGRRLGDGRWAEVRQTLGLCRLRAHRWLPNTRPRQGTPDGLEVPLFQVPLFQVPLVMLFVILFQVPLFQVPLFQVPLVMLFVIF